MHTVASILRTVSIAALAAILLSGCARDSGNAELTDLQQQLNAQRTQTAELLSQLAASNAATVTATPDDRAIVTVVGGTCYTGRTLVDTRVGAFFPEVDPDVVPIDFMQRGVQGSLCFNRSSDCIKNARVGAPLPIECGGKP
jgi:hypothetical protein